MTLAPELSPAPSEPLAVAAVCFDVDATLVDYEGSTRAGLRELLGTDEAWGDWCALSDRHYLRYLAGDLDFDTMRRQRTRDFFASRGEVLCDGEVSRREELRAAAVRRSWRLFDDALPCLRAIRSLGLRLAAITNAAGDYQRAKLGALGLESAFDAVLISGELGVAKPHRAIFRTACRVLDVSPAQAVHVGDRLDTDAKGARDAGLHGVWLDRSGRGALPEGAGISVIGRLAELPALVTRHIGRAVASRVEPNVLCRLTSLPGAGSGSDKGPATDTGGVWCNRQHD
ncbi:MAG: HAD family hydrolase [Actinomycetota bacterium]|nr:HAD family hydrolase [Actinomycetota bacterium]